MSWRRLPIRAPVTYVIVDNGRYPTDKEYIELGVRQGWLILYRIVALREGEEHQYVYPDTVDCE